MSGSARCAGLRPGAAEPMSQNLDPQYLFDRPLIRARALRFAGASPQFLRDYALQDISEKLQDIKRDFDRICVLDWTPSTQDALFRAGHTGEIIAVNQTAGLVTPAGGQSICAASEALPLAARSMPCIVSLLDLQLVNDLPGALVQIERALSPDGLFIGVMLGGGSLQELREVFLQAESEITGGAALRVAPFADVRDLGGLMQRAGFALPVVDADQVTVRYAHMLDLLKDLRHMGWANPLAGRPRNFLRRDVLVRAGEIYAERFSDPDGRIRATFTLVWLTGWSPHESQQKPLKPGSAKVRLADALGTSERGFDAKASD